MKKLMTKEVIQQVAAELFRKFGFEKTSMDDIASKAHKAKRSIYNHFSNKEELFCASVVSETDHIRQRLTEVMADDSQLVLPRLGYELQLPKELDNFSYYGRGPIDNYPDRKSSQYLGIWQNKVAADFEPFPKPQDMANHQDTRWCSLTDDNGRGLLFIGREPMSVSVLPWSAQELAKAM